MASDRTFKDQADLQGLQGDAIIDLWTLDLQPIDSTIAPADRYLRFCNWVVADGQPVKYGGNMYTAIPYKASGFTYQTEGVPPSPSLMISNIGLEFTALVNTWDDLIGAKLTLTRVLAKYLDGQPEGDPQAHWPEERWFIQQKEDEGKLSVTFKLSTAFDLDGVTLPRRRALRYTCPWVYRGEGCDYAGPPVADVNDNPLTPSDDADLQALYTARDALESAWNTYQQSSSAYATAQANTANALAAYNNAVYQRDSFVGAWKFQQETYRYYYGHLPTYWEENYGFVTRVEWFDVPVSGSTDGEYRRGEYKESFGGGIVHYAVRKFYQEARPPELDQAVTNTQAAYNAALAAEATAKATNDAAKAAYDTASTNYETALTNAGTKTDPADVCGKRLASCRLRFFDPVKQEPLALNFGGFPGLTI